MAEDSWLSDLLEQNRQGFISIADSNYRLQGRGAILVVATAIDDFQAKFVPFNLVNQVFPLDPQTKSAVLRTISTYDPTSKIVVCFVTPLPDQKTAFRTLLVDK